ncbi:MAG TPA: hypothetical protein VLK26_11800 [Rudaea sp.]|nr:hypothetical protein [Rudaea sp.]
MRHFVATFVITLGKTMKTLLSKIGLSALLAFAVIASASADSSNDAGKPSSAKAATPSPPSAFTATYTLTASSPTQIDRLTRDGVPSTCATPKTYPGGFSPGTPYVHLVTASFSNPTGSAVCATVTLAASATCVGNVFATAYSGSFNPGDLSANYLADSGSSLISASSSESFEVLVPANGSIVFNINEANQDATENCGFTISSPNLIAAASAAPTIPAPALELRNLILVGLGLLVLGLIVIKRRMA